MSNWRFIVILGMILIGIGIIPASGYEEMFSLSVSEGGNTGVALMPIRKKW